MKVLDKLIGMRFNSIIAIRNYCENILNMKNVNIIKTENETDESLDFVLDCESDCSMFSIFYLLDNKGLMYITEIC